MSADRVCRVALPAPLHQLFDYLPPADVAEPAIGARVRVPFGPRRQAVGVVLEIAEKSLLPRARLKRIGEALDAAPLLPEKLLSLLRWAADYYHHPVGEVIAAALPTLLRQGRAPEAAHVTVWRATSAGLQALADGRLARVPARRRLLAALRDASDGLEADALGAISARWSEAIKKLQAEGYVSAHPRDCLRAPSADPQMPPPLNTAQRDAITSIAAADGFQGFLLHGVTGSGKTEVYLGAIEAVLARGRQALVLVPEIGLTPQLVGRFARRFRAPLAVLHSGLTDTERLCAWTMAREGKAPIVIGTRSAVFAPLKNIGLIVVDEEHDGSYKQQEGFRYSARDVAVMRAAREKIPVVLGSATPALESLYNVRQGNYRELTLPERTGAAGFPLVQLVDLRRQKAHDSLSPRLVEAIRARLERGEQSLLFLNRRGFAPAWMCHDCGWVAPCQRCDARLTFHQLHKKLLCHHCGAEQAIPETCPACAGTELRALGAGTERVEQALAKFFPMARTERIDRDSTRAKGMLEEKIRRAHAGEADILVGTQMLSKGHDFPNVTLVGVLDADQGLYGADFRAPERLFQQVLQVAGRAGRADKPGEVLIQTWHPEHPIFAALARHDFNGFADYALAERQEAGYPPYAHLALLRAESPNSGAALHFLRAAHAAAARLKAEGVTLHDPVPAPMEKRAGRYRAQLLAQSAKRAALHGFLDRWLEKLAAMPQARRVRWSLDVDPQDMY
ncbi:MAG: primosomal protein N' [Gammaproteobacteria bacterium]|nr:MAG: primosomal protein N' [Gammaproteobacteria bacterium]